MRTMCILLIGALALTACTQQRESRKVAFDGIAFRMKAKAVDKRVSRADFTVEIRDAVQSLDGAREAGRWQGTRYCIENYGTSVIDWVVGPDSDASQLTLVNGDLTLRGK